MCPCVCVCVCVCACVCVYGPCAECRRASPTGSLIFDCCTSLGSCASGRPGSQANERSAAALSRDGRVVCLRLCKRAPLLCWFATTPRLFSGGFFCDPRSDGVRGRAQCASPPADCKERELFALAKRRYNQLTEQQRLPYKLRAQQINQERGVAPRKPRTKTTAHRA